jgi:hypothetical protein
MQRYQTYLKSETVDKLDNMARELGISRSQLIRDVVDRMARVYEKLISAAAASKMRNNPLLKMAGFAKFGKNIAENIDEIYLKD